MTSAPRSSKLGEKCALVALAATLMHPGLALAQEPVGLLTQAQAEVVEMGPHHRVWSRAELVPDGMGGWCAEERRVTELATGLGRWDEGQQAYVPARAAFEVTESGHVIARETAHQLILPPGSERERSGHAGARRRTTEMATDWAGDHRPRQRAERAAG